MTPLQQHMIESLWDKGLLLGTGWVLSFVIAKVMERHKRREATALEINKAQAQALLRTVQHVVRHYNMTERITARARDAGLKPTDPWQPDPYGVDIELDDLRTCGHKMARDLCGDVALISPEVFAACLDLVHLSQELFNIRVGGNEPGADFERRKKEIGGRLKRHFPDFALPAIAEPLKDLQAIKALAKNKASRQ